MRMKPLFTLLVLVMLVPAVMLGLSGCSGGSSPLSTVQDSVTEDNEELAVNTADVAEAPEDTVTIPQSTEVSMPPTEPIEDNPVEQPVLTWARDAGGLNHCDRLSIYQDGRVEAIVCRVNTSEPVVHSTLSDEQIAQVNGWVAAHTLFTRREMEMSRAVRTTVLQGTGDVVPELEAKVEIAAFAADIFFALTGTE